MHEKTKYSIQYCTKSNHIVPSMISDSVLSHSENSWYMLDNDSRTTWQQCLKMMLVNNKCFLKHSIVHVLRILTSNYYKIQQLKIFII